MKANLNEMIENVENPKVILEQHINEIRKALIETKAAIAKVESIPNKKAKLNYDVAMAEVSKWEENLRKAQQANSEHLIFYARERLKNHQASARVAESHVDKHTEQSDTLKQNLVTLEKRLNEAESLMNRLNLAITLTNSVSQDRKETRLSGIEKRLENLEHELETTREQLLEQQKVTTTLLNSNSNALKVVRKLLIELDTHDTENNNQQEDIESDPQVSPTTEETQLKNMIDRIGTSSAMSVFERMEKDNVLEIQVHSPAAFELTGNDLEKKFAQLASGSDVDDELAEMRKQLSRGSVLQQDLPTSEENTTISLDSAVDAELEALRKQIDSI
jgi:phage shock protein A